MKWILIVMIWHHGITGQVETVYMGQYETNKECVRLGSVVEDAWWRKDHKGERRIENIMALCHSASEYKP